MDNEPWTNDKKVLYRRQYYQANKEKIEITFHGTSTTIMDFDVKQFYFHSLWNK